MTTILICLLCVQAVLISWWVWIKVGQEWVWRFEDWLEERRRKANYLSPEARRYVDMLNMEGVEGAAQSHIE